MSDSPQPHQSHPNTGEGPSQRPDHRPRRREHAAAQESPGTGPPRGGGPRRGRGRPYTAGSGNGRMPETSGGEGAHTPHAAAPGARAPGLGPKRGRRPPRPRNDGARPTNEAGSAGPSAPAEADGNNFRSNPKGSRRAKFGADLTEGPSDAVRDQKPSEKYRRVLPQGDDLTSTLIRALSTKPYPDCLICFAEMHPAQPTWSCSPSLPTLADQEDSAGNTTAENDNARCCWTTFHLKCIRSWAEKSMKDTQEAWRARGEEKPGEWRCPGCQSKRKAIPASYWCFCGSTAEPKLSHLATPHSCGNPCTRPRVCGHSCPIACHPGPCPPCQVTTQKSCHCGKHVLSFRCSNLAPSKTGVRPAADLSCGEQCGRKLGCGTHVCEDVCHAGPCKPCAVKETVRCYCGKDEKVVGCGEGVEQESAVVEDGEEKQWIGRFACTNPCDRLFDCGDHRCSKPCHPPSRTPAPCPRSPSLVTHCPCGKHEFSPSSAPYFPQRTRLVRTTCSDPIPTCTSVCMKPLAGCTHACSVPCHLGPCPPCSIMVVRPCRCSATTRDIRCSDDQRRDPTDPETEILCTRVCTALRTCGRHQCARVCCPLASLAAATKGKGKKRANPVLDSLNTEDEAGWHQCDLICGRMLGCGNHQCEERDHRGACPPCLRSSFEEMVCHCGRTVLEPPIPCGTRINCTFPCARAPPECGHPKTPHACHEDSTPCPPCPFLAAKQCACGKKVVGNVRCSQEKVSCGTPCGKLLACGFHHCERLCHSDPCGACTTVCGKSRRLCLPAHHPCTQQCHAPASCDESEPCRATITLSCPCGRIRSAVPCGRCTSNPAGREGTQQLKCSNECLIAKRNARLAEALGIDPTKTNGPKATYADHLVSFAKADPKFCFMVEKALDDFASSDKKSQILPSMPEARRKFVHDLAAIYRMDTRMMDQEPHRSVQLIRRVDTRVPSPLLSAAGGITPTSTPHTSANLGKLADLRAPVARPRPSPAVAPLPSSAAGLSGPRGWTSVVARPPTGSPRPDLWGTPTNSRPPSRPTASPSPAPPTLPTAPAARSPQDVPDDWEQDV